MIALTQSWRSGAFALALLALPLAGCSSLLPGASTNGNNSLTVAQLPDVGDVTADQALAQARDHFRNSDYGYSAALYQRYVSLMPKDPQGYVGLGASYDRLGRFDLSDRTYQTLLQVGGSSAQYYNNVGYSYLLRGNLTAALSNFRSAHKLDPDSAVINNNLQILANAYSAKA